MRGLTLPIGEALSSHRFSERDAPTGDEELEAGPVEGRRREAPPEERDLGEEAPRQRSDVWTRAENGTDSRLAVKQGEIDIGGHLGAGTNGGL